MWQFDALGIGNLARIKQQRGDQSQAIVQLYRTQDSVAAEVTEAHANLQSATARVTQANRSLRTALTAYNGNVEGLRQTTRFGDTLVLVYRPQEVVYALRLLKLAFDEYFTTVADYNRAEFELLTTRWATRRARSPTSGLLARSSLSTPIARPTCRLSATGRPRPRGDVSLVFWPDGLAFAWLLLAHLATSIMQR